MECKKTSNIQICNCTYPCERKGICCECLNYHRKMNELPACYFNEKSEKTYDRSIEFYFKTKK